MLCAVTPYRGFKSLRHRQKWAPHPHGWGAHFTSLGAVVGQPMLNGFPYTAIDCDTLSVVMLTLAYDRACA